MDLIENAKFSKSKTKNFITKFSKIYTPVVIIIALIIAITFPSFFDKTRIKKHEEIAGYGIKAKIDDKYVVVGNKKIMTKIISKLQTKKI